MLVLQRKLNEEIVIHIPAGFNPGPDGANVIVAPIQFPTAERVRLGFHAQEAIQIHRREVWERMIRGMATGSPS